MCTTVGLAKTVDKEDRQDKWVDNRFTSSEGMSITLPATVGLPREQNED